MPILPDPNALTMEDIEAELDAIEHPTHPNALVLSGLQKAALKHARPGQRGGIPWMAFLNFWRLKGWPGSEDTLRKYYREMEDADAVP